MNEESPQLPAVVEAQAETQALDLTTKLVEAGADILKTLAYENTKAQVQVAEVNKPIQEKAQQIQADNNKRHWDNVDAERIARIGSEKRIYVLAFFLIATLLGFAAYSMGNNHYDQALMIIGIIIGFVTGFIGGRGWPKSKMPGAIS